MAYVRELERGPDNIIPAGTPLIRVYVEANKGVRTLNNDPDEVVVVTLSESLGRRGSRGMHLVREMAAASSEYGSVINLPDRPDHLIEIHPDSGNVMKKDSTDPVRRFIESKGLKVSATKSLQDDGSEKPMLTMTTVSKVVVPSHT